MADLALFYPLTHLPQRLAVGVSGGVDSVALLHALLAVGRKPEVWHFDHAWRKDSASDAQWVKKLAQTHGLSFVSARARPSVKHSENTARQQRWAFFLRTARRRQMRHLVLAHQADDQVETFLWQLLRGTGSQGAGMAPIRQQNLLTIHRPWLDVWRKQIKAYAQAAGLHWRQDATNLDLAYTRNRLRHRVLPYLRRAFSPHIDTALWRAAEIQRAEQEWMDRLTQPASKQPKLSVKQLQRKSLGQVRRILKQWLQEQGVNDVSFNDVENVRRLLTEAKPAKINLSKARHARRRAGWLFLEEP